MDFQEIRSGWDERSPSGRAYLAEGGKAVDMRHHEVKMMGESTLVNTCWTVCWRWWASPLSTMGKAGGDSERLISRYKSVKLKNSFSDGYKSSWAKYQQKGMMSNAWRLTFSSWIVDSVNDFSSVGAIFEWLLCCGKKSTQLCGWILRYSNG